MSRLPNRRNVAAFAVDQDNRPIYLLDDDRRIVYCNAAFARWLGVAADSMIGQYVEGKAMPVAESVPWQGLCPPPAARHGRPSEGEIWIAPDAAPRRFPAIFLPLAGESDEDSTFVMVVVFETATGPTERSFRSSEKTSSERHRGSFPHSASLDHPFRIDALVGTSALIQQIQSQVALASTGTAPVLIHGPAGSGRESIARTIHQARGQGQASRLLPLDCRLLDDDLLQTTLAAFVDRSAATATTGADSVLLLEVDQLDRDAQAGLTDRLRHIGDRMAVIATASLPLSDQIAFRPQLAAALSTLTIRVPPLIERLEDLPLLIQSMIERGNRDNRKPLEGLSPRAFDLLLNHPWHGNLQELSDVLDHAREVSASEVVRPEDLPDRIRLAAEAERFAPKPVETVQLDTFMGEVEQELIRRALNAAEGNRAKAARLLGISRARLLRRLAALGLNQ